MTASDWFRAPGKRSPAGTKFGSPAVMGILFSRGGKDPRQAARICDRSGRHAPIGRDTNSGTAPEGRRGGQVPSHLAFATNLNWDGTWDGTTSWLMGVGSGHIFLIGA